MGIGCDVAGGIGEGVARSGRGVAEGEITSAREGGRERGGAFFKFKFKIKHLCLLFSGLVWSALLFSELAASSQPSVLTVGALGVLTEKKIHVRHPPNLYTYIVFSIYHRRRPQGFELPSPIITQDCLLATESVRTPLARYGAHPTKTKWPNPVFPHITVSPRGHITALATSQILLRRCELSILRHSSFFMM